MSDFSTQRLFIDAPIEPGDAITATAEQANYLLNVLRLGDGADVLVFNGRQGEWRARVSRQGKRGCALAIIEQVRGQTDGPDIHYLFAPLKRSRLDYMVQKATELGVALLQPTLTRRTVAERVNLDRMRANAIEAAEQCGVLRVPAVAEPHKLEKLMATWDPSRTLVFCDEGASVSNPIVALTRGLEAKAIPGGAPLAVLIGPEGGFDPAERDLLGRQSFTITISLGPRIMRADTAAVAALAIVNAVAGDWR